MRALAFALLLLPGLAAAALVYTGREVRGQVVDADSGTPLEGVVVVARWEWRDYLPTLFGYPYRNVGNALHIAEAVTDRNGRFAIPGWGPKGRATGRLDDREDPKLSLFKSGYVPLELHNRSWTNYMQPNPATTRGSEWDGKTLELRKSTVSPTVHAEQIRRFQEGSSGGLWWHHRSEHWKSMPRMVFALHQEKRRLGDDGHAILGVNRLHGRSGRGELRDAHTNAAVENAVVQITWALRREGGSATRRLVEQRHSGVEGGTAAFYVTPWQVPGPAAPGWEIASETPPLVRIYAPGYRRTAEQPWDERGGTIQLQKVPDTKEAVLAELRAWRSDIDAALAAPADRAEALAGQQHLLRRLSHECRTLTADVRPGICFAPGSEVERYVEQLRGLERSMKASPDAGTFGVAAARPGGAGPAGGAMPGYIPPVSGFSIEPAK